MSASFDFHRRAGADAVGLRSRGQSRRRGEHDRGGERRRRRLHADARDDEHPGAQSRAIVRGHPSPRKTTRALAGFRELARKHGLYLHVGSLAIKLSPDRAANRSFLIDREGEIVARYDKIHMFDVDLANGESYREFAQLPSGRDRGGSRPALGAARAHRLLRSALSRALPRAGGSRQLVPRHSVGLHRADRRGALACADARPRDRERCVRAGGGAGRQARERARDLRPFARRRSLGPCHRRGRQRAGRGAGQDRSCRGRGGARQDSFAPARAALRDDRADGGARPPARGGAP